MENFGLSQGMGVFTQIKDLDNTSVPLRYL